MQYPQKQTFCLQTKKKSDAKITLILKNLILEILKKAVEHFGNGNAARCIITPAAAIM